MKIVCIDEYNFIIFLNKFYQDINFDEKNYLEEYFKKLFLRLNDKYQLPISGYYDIDIYVDTNYGIVLDIKKEELEYLDYFSGQIDMKITSPKKSVFLYKINDLFGIDKDLIKDINIYKYQNNFYVRIINPLNDIKLGKLLEWGTILYKDSVTDIMRKGVLVNL